MDKREELIKIFSKDIREILKQVTVDFEQVQEIRLRFITIQGGHRIGIAGKTITDGHGIRSMKFISFINVRLSHQVKGCAGTVLPYLYDRDMIFHTLIVSPPRCGKTTLLRDIIRQVSKL